MQGVGGIERFDVFAGPSTAIKLLVQHGTLEKAARAQSSKLCYEDSKIKLYNAFSTL